MGEVDSSECVTPSAWEDRVAAILSDLWDDESSSPREAARAVMAFLRRELKAWWPL